MIRYVHSTINLFLGVGGVAVLDGPSVPIGYPKDDSSFETVNASQPRDLPDVAS